MSLTIKSFFSNFILKPWEAKSTKEKALAWTGSIFLALATACTIHVGCALVKYAIIPIADKTGLTAKIDELRDRYFPDTTSAEEKRTKKRASRNALDSRNVTSPTKEQEKALTKGKKQSGATNASPKKSIVVATAEKKPQLEDDIPIPKDWAKAEANMRSSDHPDDKFTSALLDNPKFKEGCIAMANQFLENPDQDPKAKIGAYVNLWEALRNDPKAQPEGKMPEGSGSASRAALWIILKNNLSKEKFTTFQNWFIEDQNLVERDYAEWFFVRGALDAINFQENRT